jgi:hypothetical protein
MSFHNYRREPCEAVDETASRRLKAIAARGKIDVQLDAPVEASEVPVITRRFWTPDQITGNVLE